MTTDTFFCSPRSRAVSRVHIAPWSAACRRPLALSLTCALLAGFGPSRAAHAEDVPLYRFENGYVLQSGLSVLAIPLTKNDRLQHVAAGSAISALVTYKTGSFWKGCAAALAAGLAKEAYDDLSDTGRFEARDVGYTLAGCSFTLRF